MICSITNWDRENQAIHSADPGDDFDEHLLESDDENMDPGEPDSESDSGEPDPDEPTLLCTGKSPKSGDITSRFWQSHMTRKRLKGGLCEA
jgi:hypothetical protein